MTPQIIYLIIIALSLGLNMSEHGTPRSPTNFWNNLISTAIIFWILIAGGFFKCFGWG